MSSIDELVARTDALRRLHSPEIPDADWHRAVRYRGLWAALAYLYTLAKQHGSARGVQAAARYFNWCVWSAPKADDPLAMIAGSLDLTLPKAGPAVTRRARREAVAWFEAQPVDRRREIEARYSRGARGRLAFAQWIDRAYRNETVSRAQDDHVG